MDKKILLLSLGARIKNARRERGMTQEELAVMLDINSITISRWETGKQSPNYTTLCRIADVLDVSLPDLVEQRSEEFPGGSGLIGRKRKLDIASNLERILRDVAHFNPDVIVMIHEIADKWDVLDDSGRQVLVDGLAFVLGNFRSSNLQIRDK
jgi:transcriptional regulator with XRE-family HTH domain